MLSEEEKKAIERVEDTFYENKGKGINNFQKITLYEDGILDILKLLNIVEKLQKENEEVKQAINVVEKEKKQYIEENKEIEEKLDWEEIIGSVGKPLWDNKKKIWRVLDSYYREGNSFKISFSDTNNLECFENQELCFKEREEK